MLEEWEDLAAELAEQSPQKVVSADQVGAVTLARGPAVGDAEGAAKSLCEGLQGGWRPVLVYGVAPCIAYVPWLDFVDELAAAVRAPRPVPTAASTEGASSASGKSATEVCELTRRRFAGQSSEMHVNCRPA